MLTSHKIFWALAFVFLAAAAAQAQETDRTLESAGDDCITAFNETAALYEADPETAPCADLLRTALTVPGGEECPETGPESEVFTCLTATDEAKTFWEEFFRECEVLNIYDRLNEGLPEAEAEAEAGEEQPSCFETFPTWTAFEAYLDGEAEAEAEANETTTEASPPPAEGGTEATSEETTEEAATPPAEEATESANGAASVTGAGRILTSILGVVGLAALLL